MTASARLFGQNNRRALPAAANQLDLICMFSLRFLYIAKVTALTRSHETRLEHAQR
jgi:hypothetical protein